MILTGNFPKVSNAGITWDSDCQSWTEQNCRQHNRLFYQNTPKSAHTWGTFETMISNWFINYLLSFRRPINLIWFLLLRRSKYKQGIEPQTAIGVRQGEDDAVYIWFSTSRIIWLKSVIATLSKKKWNGTSFSASWFFLKALIASSCKLFWIQLKYFYWKWTMWSDVEHR